MDQIEQFALLGVLEHNKDVAGRVDELEVLDDVRVVEPAEDFNLALHLLEDTLQLDFALVEDFDCDFVVCDLVYGH